MAKQPTENLHLNQVRSMWFVSEAELEVGEKIYAAISFFTADAKSLKVNITKNTVPCESININFVFDDKGDLLENECEALHERTIFAPPNYQNRLRGLNNCEVFEIFKAIIEDSCTYARENRYLPVKNGAIAKFVKENILAPTANLESGQGQQVIDEALFKQK